MKMLLLGLALSLLAVSGCGGGGGSNTTGSAPPIIVGTVTPPTPPDPIDPINPPDPPLVTPPDISSRSNIQIPYQTTRSFVKPTAVAASTQFALVGSGQPRRSTSLVGFPIPVASATYTANPVMVTSPSWLGTPSKSLNINPPLNPLGVERFGQSLAIHKDRVAIGSTEVFTWHAHVCCSTHPLQPGVIVFEETADNGRVHLYQYNGTSFAPERIIEYGGLDERFGAAVSLDAAHLLVGRPGANPGAADLFDPNTGSLITTFSSPSAHDGFGETLVLAGDLALVGARDQDTVYVYRRGDAGMWSAAGVLTSPGAGSEFGTSITADGERILVGAPGIDRAYLFEDDGDDEWPVVAELSGGDDSGFGTAVALTGDTAFIAAPRLLYDGKRLGLVARHERAGDGTWPFITHRNSRRPADRDGFGNAIAASTTMLTVIESGFANRPSELSVFSAPAGD
jgi:hypothetical protein